ncbi:hypothetical protein CsatB_021191 [Cannabis sativa]|uniref:Exostosin GT47 domain-containing protein n=2 Tax=Cannabis sativa TaxID=3483 RepID=A0A7J6HRA1_CANSA|nr:probable glycosyltransferase At5g03795 isoform X1 [Cannabis sativa]KAF4397535.1 hypothetical protein G4B88_027275 [Cannabis sativa]
MKMVSRRPASALMRQIFQHCALYRIDWRKIFFAGALMTITGVMLQTLTLPYPLNKWFLSPPVTVSLDEPFNVTIELTNNRVNESRVQQFQLLEAVPNVLLNSPAESNFSVSVEPKIPAVSVQTRKSLSRRRRKSIDVGSKPNHTAPPTAPHKTVPFRLQKFVGSFKPNQALKYARKEINHAPLVTDDPELYAPLFLNISLFKRSYELMETVLKVYIYPDGSRPIFHHPHLQGIYASEGWFMKLMEGNKQFVTKDPEKAHLFYLPYSARQLEMALYVPESHNLKPLSIYLRNYVKKIAAKYPFWNRSHGSDHFLVACHDWGPYTVNEHKELSKNTIKVLCNADLSEGVFVRGKDVSLPETTIRTPRRPLRNIGGGKRVSQRPILSFFAGNMHGRVRPTLLKHWHNKDEDMKIYGPLPARVSRKMSYIQHMKSSKYCICPMGYEVNSPRIIEAIYYECVPVIIADNFVLPLSEVLNWSAFSVIVAEKDIPNLKEILLAIPLKRYLTMQINVKMVQKHFIWNPRPIRYDLFHMILHSIWFNRLNQIQIST